MAWSAYYLAASTSQGKSLCFLQAGADSDLAAKVLTLIMAAMNAADAEKHAALRLRFLRRLMDKGVNEVTMSLLSAQIQVAAQVCTLM